MKILAISGSPRIGKNSEEMVNYALDIAKKNGYETDNIFLSGLKIAPCIACGLCKTKKECSQKDDFQRIMDKLESADAIIMIAPVYMGSMTAQLKALIDRTVLFRRNKFLFKNKIGAAICVGGSRNGGQELTIQNIHAAMHIHGMIVIGDNNHFGGTSLAPFSEDEFGKMTVKETVEKVIETLKLFK